VPLLFSYGTLQQPEVQRANYGRLLDGTPDVLVGYSLEALAIADPDVVRVSGKAVHTSARVEGVRFELTEAELAATDEYEVDAYARTEVVLESDVRAFVYVGRSMR
jgi:Gamma-glutamyl cyclotransferase, AIG2-like